MLNWLAKVMATVTASVVIFYLTTDADTRREWLNWIQGKPQQSAPAPPAGGAQQGGAIIAWLVVPTASPIRNASDLGIGTRVCVSRGVWEMLRGVGPLTRIDPRFVPPAELYPAMETGVCSIALVQTRDQMDRAFPTQHADVRTVPVKI